MKKKGMAILLTALMALGSLVPGGPVSEAKNGDLVLSGTTGDCKYMFVETGENKYAPYTMTVSGNGEMADYKLLEGKDKYDKTDSPYHDYLTKTNKVVVKDGVTRVGNYAFAQAFVKTSNIKEVVLADSVKEIGHYAFKNQLGIQSIDFGNSLTNIGYYAFDPSSIQKLNFPQSLTGIGMYAFRGWFNLNHLTFPDGLKGIMDHAFMNCSGLRIVSFGKGMGIINKNVFEGCKNLKAVILPSNIKTIRDNAFKDDSNLTDIYYGGTSTEWNALKSNTGQGNDSFLGATVHFGLDDLFTLSTEKPVAGTYLQLRFNTNDYFLSRMTETFTIKWQRSPNGSTGWVDLDQELDPKWGPSYYHVAEDDVDYYIRAKITKEGFSNPAYSSAVKVLDGISIDSAFSDPNLRQYMKDTYDENHDEILTVSEIEKIHFLNIGNMGIKSLTGIEYLFDLQDIYAYRNEFSYVNVSGSPHLRLLDVSDNPKLTTVNVKENPYLATLDVSDATALTKLDLSGNPELEELAVYRSKIGKIDIRNNPRLVYTALHGNKKDMNYFDLYTSDQGELQLSDQTLYLVALDEAHFPSECFRKMLSEKNYDWDQDGILSMQEALDVETLSPEDSEDAIQTLKGIEYFPNLKYLSSFNCRIPTVDLRYNQKLEYLYLGGNGLKSLDVSQLTELQVLDVDYNPELKTLDLSQNNKLGTLYCWGCGLKSLDLSANKELSYISAGENELETLDLKGLPQLTYLSLSLNPLKSLDLTKNTKLKTLYLNDTKLGKLDVTGLPELGSLSCSGMGLTELDVTKNPKLFNLACYGNRLATLDITKNPMLQSAYAGTKKDLTNSETGAKYQSFCSKENSSYQLYLDPGQVVKVKDDVAKTEPDEKGTWKEDSTGWWFKLSAGGFVKNRWAKIGGKWYHFDKNGYMQTGWLKDGGKWYYLGKNGAMVTGWKKIDGVWYYFAGSGAMVKGWKKISGVWYYFKPDGAMASKEYCKGYWLNKDGSWTYEPKASWKKDAKGWYYIDTKGWYAKNCTMKIDNKNYSFDKKGYCTNP